MNRIKENFLEHSIVPVFYDDDFEVCKKVIDSCYEGGIRIFEFVNRGEQAVSNFRKILSLRDSLWPEMTLGIGTIKTVTDFKVFSKLGADFLVSPFWSYDIAVIANETNVLWIPGCMTVSEIGAAERGGLTLVKIFPGGVLGKDFLKAVVPLFPKLIFMVTGGVEPTKESVLQWKLAGATNIGIGAKLFNCAIDQIADRCKELLI